MANSRNTKLCFSMSLSQFRDGASVPQDGRRDRQRRDEVTGLAAPEGLLPNTGSISLAAAAKASLIQPRAGASPAEPVPAATLLPPR